MKGKYSREAKGKGEEGKGKCERKVYKGKGEVD